MPIKPNEQFNVSAQYIQLVSAGCAEKNPTTKQGTGVGCSMWSLLFKAVVKLCMKASELLQSTKFSDGTAQAFEDVKAEFLKV